MSVARSSGSTCAARWRNSAAACGFFDPSATISSNWSTSEDAANSSKAITCRSEGTWSRISAILSYCSWFETSTAFVSAGTL